MPLRAFPRSKLSRAKLGTDQLQVARVRRGRPRTRPDALLGDKAYSSQETRVHLRSRGITAVIPEPADQAGHRKRQGSNGGRRIGLDTQKYKRCNVIERSFNTVKNWRGLATRYDKLAITYRAAALLAAICAWLRHLRDTP